MMYKSNSKAGRRWAVLAAVPATVAAIAVLNVPAFAEVLSETEQASISFPSADKVTNINSESKIPSMDAIDETVIEVAEISGNDLAQETTVASEDKKSADTKDKKEDKADASKLEIYVNGEKVTSEQMHTIDPADIQSMDIKKNSEGNPNTINITLKEGKTLKSAATTSKSVKENNSKDVFVAVEQQAEYPGGLQELMKYLVENVKYPEEAVKNNVQGNVIVKFVVSKTGKIRDAQVLKSVDPELDKEAIRVIESMPAWIPAKNNGEAVDSYFNLPVSFKLRSDAETKNNPDKAKLNLIQTKISQAPFLTIFGNDAI